MLSNYGYWFVFTSSSFWATNRGLEAYLVVITASTGFYEVTYAIKFLLL